MQEEPEFDAVTEMLQPKRLYLATLQQCQQHIGQLKGAAFVTAFTAPSLQQEVEGLWQEMARAGPPLFRKVRPRQVLDQLQVRLNPHKS